MLARPAQLLLALLVAGLLIAAAAMPNAVVLAALVLLPFVLLMIPSRRARYAKPASLVEDESPPRCFRCGYDIRASVGRCPECGETIYPADDPMDWPAGEARDGGVFWRARIEEYVVRRLLGRPQPAGSAWHDDERRLAVARFLADACREACRWPNDHFFPGDCFRLMLIGGDLGVLEVFQKLEHQFHFRPDARDIQLMMSYTFGQVVDFLLDHRPAY